MKKRVSIENDERVRPLGVKFLAHVSTRPTRKQASQDLRKRSTKRLEADLANHRESLNHLKVTFPEEYRLRGISADDPLQHEISRLEDAIAQFEIELARRPTNNKAALGARPQEFGHSADFRSIRFRRTSHSLTPRQAQVVQLLFEAYRQGTPELSVAYILESLGTQNSRLQDTFRNSPLWRTLIVPGKRKGTYRLDLTQIPSST